MHTGAMQRPLRVLCTSTGGAGHVYAVAPVARALRDRGHDVQWAVAADGGGAVEAMGFEWSAAGLTTSARYAVATGLDGLMKLPTEERRGPLFTAVFARAAAPMMREDLAPIIDRVRPDLVVRETAELAAAPMAAARGIPLVTVAFSGVLPERARGQVVDALRPLWQAEGLGDPSWADVYGQLYLHPFPVSFGQRPDSTVVRPIRPDRGSPSVAPAAWVASLGVDRPFVYVTSGTEPPSVTFPWPSSSPCWAPSTSTLSPPSGPTSTRRRSVRYRPTCASSASSRKAICSDGPAQSSPTAAPARSSALPSHGRPQLVVPLFADQWENGVAVDDAGCGIVLGPTRRGMEDLEQALRTVLAGSSHREAATRVADEIAAMPTATDLAPEVEALVGT